MSAVIFQGPATDLSAVELEGEEAGGFGGGEAVRARWGASQAFPEQVGDRFGPSLGVIPSGGSVAPQGFFLLRAGPEESGAERIEATAGDAELLSGLGSG